QVYFSYGGDDFSNYKMLVQYGFAQMLNKADEARLGWGLMDAVGQVDPPTGYTSLLKDLDKEKGYLVYESNDGQAINEWWSDSRLALLENEAFPAVENSFMSSLKMGKKMTGSARSDGTYDPILLTASLVSTMPNHELEKLMMEMKSSEGKKPVTVSMRHQRVLRNYLLFIFTRKLEKLLENLSSGLKFHYGSLNLWTKASEGGIRYNAKAPETDEERRIGWQSFFDRHAYAATMEVEKHYYALSPDSCVLTLYDGHLQALQASIDGLLSMDKFKAGVLKELDDLGFVLLSDESDAAKVKSSKNGTAARGEGKDESRRKGDESKKREEGKNSPKKKNRNKKRNSSNAASNGDRPPSIKLHIGNLSYSTTPSDLFDFFSRGFGRDNVLECHIPAERNSGRSRGFGFVTLPEQIARQILDSGRKCEIDGRILKVAESNSAGSNKPNRHPEAPPPVSNDRIAQNTAYAQMVRVSLDCRWQMALAMDVVPDQITVASMITTEEIGTVVIGGVVVAADLRIIAAAEVTGTIMTITGTILGIETDVSMITTVAAREATAGIATGEEIAAEKTDGRPEIAQETESDPGIHPGRDQGNETGKDPVGDREVDPVGDRRVGRGSDATGETGIGTASVAVQARLMVPQRVTEMRVTTREPLGVPAQMEPGPAASQTLGRMVEWKSLVNVAAEVVTEVVTEAGKVGRRKGVLGAEVRLQVQRALLESNLCFRWNFLII
ncbi:MAG: hypothetical protein SGILL_004145, partial [Bacillariaceae sp.]